MDTTLIVPGLYGSDADHWQSWFERKIPNCVRVVQRDWSTPDLPRWSARVRRELNRAPGRVWIVAHSFGCVAAVRTALDHDDRIAGLLLVAPADPDQFGTAAILPERSPGVPAIVVASTNDPWMRFGRAAEWAEVWDAQFISLGRAGHINVQAGFGPWPQGLAILKHLQCDATAMSERRLPEECFPQLGGL